MLERKDFVAPDQGLVHTDLEAFGQAAEPSCLSDCNQQVVPQDTAGAQADGSEYTCLDYYTWVAQLAAVIEQNTDSQVHQNHMAFAMSSGFVSSEPGLVQLELFAYSTPQLAAVVEYRELEIDL